VARIVEAVVAAVDVPVTLKIRTGWDHASRNAVRVARIAESAGIRMLAVHGRTRADLYEGSAEYDTIAAVKAAVRIPVLANGDVDSPRKAREVLARTGADGVMIGRAAQGRPWIFREIDQFLREGTVPPPPAREEIHRILRGHLLALYAFYGEPAGARVARKHVGWTARELPGGEALRRAVNGTDDAREQLAAVDTFFTDPEALGAVLPVREALAA
jgi:tRNA-dihydrouridine synthase B